MERTGRIGADEFHLHLPAVADRAPAVLGAGSRDVKEDPAPRIVPYAEIDEPRTCHLNAGTEGIGPFQMLDESFRNDPRRFFFRLGQEHGYVGGKITMFCMGRLLDDDGWYLSGGESPRGIAVFETFPDEILQLLLHLFSCPLSVSRSLSSLRLMSREKSGQCAPPSGTQNFFAQFSRHAQTAQNCRLPLELINNSFVTY
jgi:hypothetical protein